MASASCGRSALNSIVKASNRACCWRLFAPAGRAVSANAGSVAAIRPALGEAEDLYSTPVINRMLAAALA
jgi:hypothetical protein